MLRCLCWQRQRDVTKGDWPGSSVDPPGKTQRLRRSSNKESAPGRRHSKCSVLKSKTGKLVYWEPRGKRKEELVMRLRYLPSRQEADDRDPC